MAEPTVATELEQVTKLPVPRNVPGQPFGPTVLDEPAPTGGNVGPGPILTLATAVGHCMSSTLVSTLERAHVAVAPLRTAVSVEVGRNERGRLRVRRLSLEISTRPLHEEDRTRFDHCVAIFEDFCTVSGAVREGIRIDTRVAPAPG